MRSLDILQGELFVGAAVVLLLLAGLTVILKRMSRIRAGCRSTIAQRYRSEDILCHDNLAHYLGRDPVVNKQDRGKGILIVSKEELFFTRMYPELQFTIPLKRIKRILTPKTFLGMSSPVPLLVVDYRDEDNRIVSAAWKVQDVDGVSGLLKAQRRKIQPRKK